MLPLVCAMAATLNERAAAATVVNKVTRIENPPIAEEQTRAPLVILSTGSTREGSVPITAMFRTVKFQV